VFNYGNLEAPARALRGRKRGQDGLPQETNLLKLLENRPRQHLLPPLLGFWGPTFPRCFANWSTMVT